MPDMRKCIFAIPFEDCMKSKGLICEDVPIDGEEYWKYCGMQTHCGQYRLRYGLMKYSNKH